MANICTILSFFAHLKWVLDFLISHAIFNHRMFFLPEHFHGGNTSSFDEVECAVCLRRIDDDDEISELRCDHVCHRSCLDIWLDCRHTTCPSCHDNLLVPQKLHASHSQGFGSQEVLFFDFCRRDSNTDYGTWWLR